MYKVRNISLDKVFAKYGNKPLMSLNDDDLIDICENILKTPPALVLKTEKDEQGQEYTEWVFSRLRTIEKIRTETTIDFYMGKEYLSEEKRKELKANGFFDALKDIEDGGRSTFNTMASYKLGVSQLQAGDEVEVDWTDSFIKATSEHPYSKRLEITKLEDKTSEEEEVKEVKKSK